MSPRDEEKVDVSAATSRERQLIPAEKGRPRTEAPPKSAAGLPAVVSSMAYAVKEAGLSRSRALLHVNQQRGFDCPSCAWPDPKHRATAEFCENGARAVADEATRRKVTPEFFARHSVEDLLAMPDHWLNRQGRLTQPMIRRPGATHYAPIEWQDALSLVADRLNRLSHPDRAIFYTSGRTSNEAAFLYQLFVRQFGTNNLPDCSNMCHESSGLGLSQVIGIGKGTVTLECFDLADLILVVGQNPGTNHPRMLTALEAAKKHGAKILVINPLEEVGLVRFKHPQTLKGTLGRGSPLGDLFLRVRIGGDLALLYGLQKLLIERGALDPAYVEGRTQGFEEFKAHLAHLSMDQLVADSGVSLEQMEAATDLLASSKATIACWAMGITQHENGVANVQALATLLLLGGHYGRPGAGACPVRGHSNVQGDRTMGIWEFLPKWAPRLGEYFDFIPPPKAGVDVVGAIETMAAGQADVFFALGGNFLSATPDTPHVARGLERMDLTVQVSTKLNRSHLITGNYGLILPCLGRTERDVQAGTPQFVTVENSMGIVSKSEGQLQPASPHLWSECQIVSQLASMTLGAGSKVPWSEYQSDYDRIRDAIEAVIPGFERYNERVREPNGFALPNVVREGGFGTKTGRGRFLFHDLPELNLDRDRFWLMTIRSHDQFNTTVYDLNDRYRGIYGHRHVVLMAERDMRRVGLEDGAKVRINSHHNGQTRTVEGFSVVPYDIPTGNVACYFPESNPLVPADLYAEGSRTPASKRIEVSIEAIESA